MLEKRQGKTKIATSYRVKQPIENFKLRVKIVQQKSPLAELFRDQGETADSHFLEVEERIFSWQEKVFGPLEVKFYADEKNCITERQKEYNRRIIDESIRGSRLFSYTRDDSYRPSDGLLTKDYRSHLSRRNLSALPALRNRKPFAERYDKKVIDFDPTEARIRSNHYLYRDCEVMHVLVDLTSREEEESSVRHSPDSETLLCTVTFDKYRKVLTIDPDITNDESYTVNGTDASYEYWLEHASEQPSARELQREMESLERAARQRRVVKEVELPREIELPPLHTLRIFLGLDISSARDFPYDALFVTYLVDLPPHWSTSQQERLSGRTQRCRMRNRAAHFGYVADISLDLDLRCLTGERTLPAWPLLLISVASLDSWTRYRIEGYASLPLPSTPGAHVFHLHTWRPAGDFVNSLRRFFTGGTCELEDMRYCGVPSTHEGTKLEKAGLEVVPSGSVELKVNLAHQSRSFVSDEDFPRDAFDKLSAGTLISSVNSVLEKFKAARERMIRARTMYS